MRPKRCEKSNTKHVTGTAVHDHGAGSGRGAPTFRDNDSTAGAADRS
jgi:hypothetical protein